MPSIQLIAITPARTNVVDAEGQLRRATVLLGQAGFAGEMIRRMAKYPPQQPAYGARVSLGRGATGASGARRGARVGPHEYVRTGTLGRNWRMSRLARVGDDIIAEVTNMTDYAVYVQGDPDAPEGERQTEVMASKGWQNIIEESRAAWVVWQPRLLRVFSER